MPGHEVIARTGEGVASVPRDQWDACAGSVNPFLSHDFLTALEQSGSVGRGTGWQPLPVLIDDAEGKLLAAAPAYAKTHSQGEYVFDHGWADAWTRAGGAYYPKIQVSVPFSPVNGPRLLLRRDDQGQASGAALVAALEALVDQNELSSAHATFIAPDQVALFEQAGWLIREDSQFHWSNHGYASFDDFLGELSSAKRKNLRKERARAIEGLDIVHLTGADISEAHWDIFWEFYQDTGARKWGHPYLTRSFFSLLGERMADKILLIFAMRGDRAVAGALNMIGADTLFGRYWGCVEDVPFLHFELCYYQAIDFAISASLGKVEAGAQGSHKLARGYVPEPTFSAHYIPNPSFRRAVSDFLTRERAAVAHDRDYLSGHSPFKKG